MLSFSTLEEGRIARRKYGVIFKKIDNWSAIHNNSPARWQVADIHHHSSRSLSTNFAASP